MNNIEAFNISVAEIFGKCYESFPIRTTLSILELGDTIKQEQGNLDANDINSADIEYEIARESMKWLIDSGYLWSVHATLYEYKGVTLTPKGLEVLNAIPDQLQTKKTLGEQLSSGVSSLGKEAASDIVKMGLGYGARIILGA